jgi:hypothetical protein
MPDENNRTGLGELLTAARALAAAGDAVRNVAVSTLPLLLGGPLLAGAANPGTAVREWAGAIAMQALMPIQALAEQRGPGALAARSVAEGGGGVIGGLFETMLSPLFRLFGLGGRDDGAGAAGGFPRFVRPAREVHSLAIRAENNWTFSRGDFDGAGQARAIPQAGPQMVVQVNTMDSQWVAEHSQEIADAVKRAVLESNSLGDLFREMEG